MKQMAYARRIFGAQGSTKKDIALAVGYAPNAANSIKTKIENTRGFNNAMVKLATDSNNLALAAMAEFKARGFEDFSNKDLVGALNAIGQAWAKFNAVRKTPEEDPNRNRLRTVILQQVENQTISPGVPAPVKVEKVEEVIQETKPDDADF